MTFLILLFALVLQNHIRLPKNLSFTPALNTSLLALQTKLPNALAQTLIALAFILLLILMVIGLIQLLLSFEQNFLAFCASVLILTLLLGPDDLKATLQRFQIFLNQGQLEQAQIQAQALIATAHYHQPSQDQNTPSNDCLQVQHALILAWFNKTFLVLFGYLIAGVGGATGVVFSHWIFHTTGQLRWLLDILEWVPSRLLGLSFVFFGNFIHAIEPWLASLKNLLARAEHHLITVAVAACQCRSNPENDPIILYQNLEAIEQLITRTGIGWLIAIGFAVFF